MRLFDRILAEGMQPAPLMRADWRDFEAGLATRAVVVADNVARYALVDAPRPSWALDDFPILAPPFDGFWVEWRTPREVAGPYAAGIHVLSTAAAEWPGAPPEARWSLSALLVEQPAKADRPRARCLLQLYVDGAGRPLPAPLAHPYTAAPDAVAGALAMMAPGLFAVSLMHCTNIRRLEETPPPALSRRHEREHGRPLARYLVLIVDPGRETLLRDRGPDTSEATGPLTLCRGHFATYDERPLFGRLRGTFWKPAHVRGALSAGVRLKDYRVDAA